MNAMNTVSYPLTIFYDGSCPLCTREIALLTRFDEAQQLAVVDCSAADFGPVDGYQRASMMALIHARDAAGQWLIGAPVFAAAYSATGFASIASLWGSARLQPMWAVVYPWIANNRMWLSKLGAISAMTWVLHKLHARAAKKALLASQGCKDDACELPPRASTKKSDD
jgi:predicted DCC family thiol-disulfide oxidoreductase YuxK